MFLIITVFNKT